MHKLLLSDHQFSDTNCKRRTLINGTNYQIVQENGQRIYSPISASGIIKPPKGSEIFIGNLPHDLFEDELIPLFSKVGPIYNLRLMLDFFGRNRGYAFVSYFWQADAHRAVQSLNNFKIRNRTRMAVCISVDNRRLFIGNLARNRSLTEIRNVLDRYVEGITDIILYKEPHNPNLNRGFAFVEFQDHRRAAIARRHLCPGNLVMWGEPIYVDWAEPLPVVNPSILGQVTKLYLNNIPVEVNTDELKAILINYLGFTHNIIKVHKANDYAFVHFSIRKFAEVAAEKLKGFQIMGHVIGVEWARPIEYSKKHRLERFPENYCRFLPVFNAFTNEFPCFVFNGHIFWTHRVEYGDGHFAITVKSSKLFRNIDVNSVNLLNILFSDNRDILY